jgi:hypothetical protein
MTESEKISAIGQIVEAVTLLMDEKIHFERARRQIGGEYANPDGVHAAEERLTEMLARVVS